MGRYVLFTLLFFINIFIYSVPTPNGLSVSFLDVGQGDAIFIQSPTGVQMLVDGGATRAVLREVSKKLPFFDRSIDVIVATHPDQDHIGGLVDVLGRYKTKLYLESGVESGTPSYRALDKILDEEKIKRLIALRSMRVVLGGGAYADILFPDRPIKGVESNTASIVMRVIYGDTEFLLTGDSPKSIERYLVSLEQPTMMNHSGLQSDVLKVGHHGSKTSSDERFVSTVAPTYAVISAGKNNRYGHPHQEVLDIFDVFGSNIVNTAESGTITFHSNGRILYTK